MARKREDCLPNEKSHVPCEMSQRMSRMGQILSRITTGITTGVTTGVTITKVCVTQGFAMPRMVCGRGPTVVLAPFRFLRPAKPAPQVAATRARV